MPHVRVRSFTSDEEFTIEAQPMNTMLMAGLAQGLDMPFSCMCGDCHTCKVHVEDGTEHLQDPHPGEAMSLDEQDLADGYRLACQTFFR
jgi:ferredoxin